MQISVAAPPIGVLVVDGVDSLRVKEPTIYIHEFLGDVTPPEEIKFPINGWVSLPGYGSSELSANVKGSMLTWKEYGRIIATFLKAQDIPVTLIGNSMGAMVAIYTAIIVPNLVKELVFYRVPRFGELRIKLKNRYAEIVERLTGEDEFQEFCAEIRLKTEARIMQTLEDMSWQKAKLLYEGASLSDLEPDTIKSLTQPVTFLLHNFEGDKLHPKEAFELLCSLLPEKVHRKVLSRQ